VTLPVGGMQSLPVIGSYSDGSTYDISFNSTFASDATAIATVSPTGLVTGVSAGTATVTATHTSSGKSAAVTVTVTPLQVVSIALAPATSTLLPGGSQALTVTATFDNATSGVVTAGSTFVSSDPAVATVVSSGLVTAVAPGTATITATHTESGSTAQATVEVSAASGEFTTIDFDTPGVVYTLLGFGGAEDSTLVPDPSVAGNTVARVVKSANAELWAGTTVATGPNNTVGVIAFTATSTRMTVRVYSPRAGIPVRLKVEDASDPTRSVETETLTTVANDWETLSFDFANPVAGTPALDPAYTYNKISIFFDFGTSGAAGGGGTFYFDDVTFVGGGGMSGNTGTCFEPCIDFSSPSVRYEPFEGLVSAAQAKDPVDADNDVAKFVKGPNGQPWAGATIYTIEADKSVPAFDLSGSKVVTLRVYAPAAGLTVRLKLEDAANAAVFLEQDALTTVANEWETLSFDFASPVNGVYDPANTYNRVSVFPVFSTTAPPASELTFYFDELKYTTPEDGGSGPLVFASGYASNNRTVEGGEWGFYSGNFTSYANTYAGGGFVDQAVPAEDSYVYLVVTTSAPTTDGFMGIFTAAPGSTIAAPNAGVTLNGQTTLKIELGMAAEWFQQPANKQLTVQLIGSEVYSDGGGGSCRILIDTRLTPTTADLTTYSIELAAMNLAQPCNGGGFNSGVTTLAEALAKPIGELHVQAVFPQVNTTITNAAGTEYPTGFTRGAASFE